MKQKLAQYPKGTSFTLDVTALDPQLAAAVTSEITGFADVNGLNVRQ